MSILKILSCIWSFILGSLRIILFLACLLLLLLQIFAMVIYMIGAEAYGEIPMTGSVFRGVVETLTLLSISILGCYGSFYRNFNALKIFSILCFCYMMWILVVIFHYMTPEELAEKNKDLAHLLSSTMKDYSWKSSGSQTTESRRWDAMQHLVCCGVDGPSDWDKHRPYYASVYEYPRSCCISGIITKTNCNAMTEGIFKDGCMEKVRKLELSIVFGYASLVAYLLFTSLMACTIGNFNLERFGKRTARTDAPVDHSVFYNQSPTGNECSVMNVTSSYPKQLAHNQNYPSKGEAPPYPIVYDLGQQKPYLSAPPSYHS